MAGRKQKLTESVPGLWRIYRYFWPHMKEKRRLIVTSLLTLLGGVLLRIVEPWPLKFVIDHVIDVGPGGAGQAPSVLDRFSPLTLLLLCAVSVVAIASLRAATDYFAKVGFFVVGNHTVIRVRNQLYRHLQDLCLSYHRRARSGDLITRVTRDVNLLRDVTSTALLPLLASVMVLAGMVTVMFLLQWKLALIALATLPLFWFSTLRIGRRIRATARKQRKREGAMASIAAESLNGIAIIKSLCLENRFAEAFAERNGKSQKEDLKASRLSTRLACVVDIQLALATGLVMWFGGRLVLDGTLLPGSLLVFLVYLKRAFKPAQDFAKYTARLAKAAAAGERVIDILGEQPAVRDRPDAVPAPPLSGAVDLQHVSFGYTPERLILRDLDMTIEPEQFVALVGPSGVGKSTLLGLLLRLYEPTSGSIRVDQRDIREYTVESYRSQMSVVLQDNLLFADTIKANIACAAPEATMDEIVAAARLAQAHEFITSMADGYDSVVGERGHTLSHGQRQRIAIARAAVRATPLLILDEPTAGLDEENEQAVMRSLLELARGRTTILVTHHLPLAARADVVFYFDRGRCIECGSHGDLMMADRQYAALFRSRDNARTPAAFEQNPNPTQQAQ